MKNVIVLLIILLSVAACDKTGDLRDPEEEGLLELAYDPDYHYPPGFYHENANSYNIYYINTVSIKPPAEREHVWIELHTNNQDTARLWSDLSNSFSSVNREVVAKNETEKYFEYVRVNPDFENDSLRTRVHKTSYFQPAFDKFMDPDTLGFYPGELSLDKIRELIEYLWSGGSFGQLYKVVETSQSDEGGYYRYDLKSLLVNYGDFGITDEIQLYDNIFSIGKEDHILMVETHLLETIPGRHN